MSTKEVKTARQFITEQYEREFNIQGSPNYEPKDTEDFLFTYGDEMERAAEQYASQSVRIALEGQKADYDDVLEDHRRLVREIDEIISGKDGMAKQASLCDLVGPIQKLVEGQKGPAWVDTKTRIPHSHKVIESIVVEYNTGIVSTQTWLPSPDCEHFWKQHIKRWLDESPSSPAQPGDGEKALEDFAAWIDRLEYQNIGQEKIKVNGNGLLQQYKSSLEKDRP